MKRALLITTILGGLIASAGAKAQTCTAAPSCANLGYDITDVSICVGKLALKCPFGEAYACEKASCADLGYTMTKTQCSGRKYIPCPYDNEQVLCDSSAIIGEIRLWPTNTPPSGWKICDGQSLPIATYSALYDIIGTTYGGSGSAFLLPNLKGRVAVGVGYAIQYTYTLAEKGGANFVQLSSDQVPEHKHIMPWGENLTDDASNRHPWGQTSDASYYGSGKTDGSNNRYYTSYPLFRSGYRSYPTSSTSSWGTASTCSDTRTSSCTTSYHENRMPFLVLNYIIYTGVY